MNTPHIHILTHKHIHINIGDRSRKISEFRATQGCTYIESLLDINKGSK